MIDIRCIAETNLHPLDLISHAAKTCYTSTSPEIGQRLDVENRLFKTGHHTTLQHSFFTFHIEGISVSAITLGLHLIDPHYNSDQRSGRFSKMYDTPDFDEIENYLRTIFNPKDQELSAAMDFVKKGAALYAEHIGRLTDLSVQAIKEERPHATDKYIEQNAKKFAQEQLRVFISMIAPTAFDFTVNLSALNARYRAAFSPELRFFLQGMADCVVNKYPDLFYMFPKESIGKKNWMPSFASEASGILEKPECRLLEADITDSALKPLSSDSFDLLPFSPETMNDSVQSVKTKVQISLASMGQDQRHRAIKRGMPSFTGNFYLPPLLARAGLKETALDFMRDYKTLYKKLPKPLATALVPYGVMATYEKLADLNALRHEQAKRVCWCAQEEIFHVSLALHKELAGTYPKFVESSLAPECLRSRCLEGVRYCGRKLGKESTPFKDRVV